MGFWAKFMFGLSIATQVLAALATLEVVGGSAETPEARLQVEDRVFYVKAVVRRIV